MIHQKSEDEIKIDQAIFQRDLLNSLSGVLVTQTSSGIGHMLSVRTPITTLPYFLYLQDNVPVQSSGFFNHNALAYTNFETASSTEVLKGAGTALYGSDAFSGIINIVPKVNRDYTVRFSQRFGTYDSGDCNLQLNHSFKNKFHVSYSHKEGGSRKNYDDSPDNSEFLENKS